MTTAHCLDRFLEPETKGSTPAFARKLVDLRAEDHPTLQAHQGTLSPAEDADHREFVEAVDVNSMAQVKARRYLSRNVT